MKTIFYLFACTCLISGLTAAALNFPLSNENEEDSFDINDHLEIFYPEGGKAENLIIPFPTGRPSTTTTPEPTSITTTEEEPTTIPLTSTTTTEAPTTIPSTNPTTTEPTTTAEPSNTTIEPSTTTRRPRPRPTTSPRPRPTTSPRPRPTTSPRPTPPTTNPSLNNVQIYNNAVRSLEPFASRLVNIVLNKRGKQETNQENEISYNFNYAS